MNAPSPASSIKLTYFDIPGFGDPLRLTLAVGGIAFEDERLPADAAGYAEVARRRAAGTLPFGQVPVAEIDGRVYAQSNALVRYFGRLAGLYPDGVDQLQCDMVRQTLRWKHDSPLLYLCGHTRVSTDGSYRTSTRAHTHTNRHELSRNYSTARTE